jgi:O-glycosyl hydrolase
MERITLDPEKTFQTIESFGASGAWWAQVVGGWEEPDAESGLPKRERTAQLLFDKEKGIGLSCYRYNLGGGSAQSGKGEFSVPTRRTESFDTESGYDWSRDANAVWMLRRAAQYGVKDLVVFVNSPPERFTVNGMTHCDKPFRSNLAEKRYPDFVRYCLDCTAHFRAEGIPVRFLSPVNEPVWKWTGGQEGCHYRPRQVRRLLRLFADELDKRPDLSDLRLSGAENGDIRWFNKTYTRIILGDPKIRARAGAVDVHSYFLDPPSALLRRLCGDRLPYLRRFRRWLDRRFPGVPVRTSEWTHMQPGRDWGMDSALEQTKIMLEDLTILNVSSWQNWIAVSDVDYCDGLLYLDAETRTLAPAKRYYAFGQFSKFIEPGSVRIAADAGASLRAAAFKKGGSLAVVIANFGAEAVEAALPDRVRAIYVTSETLSLAPVPAETTFSFPPKSVTTILIAEEG